ncbi:dynein%2C light chain, LC8-type 2b [Xyrichtys novacula]|uniref:Dynein light chain n=1 Tax=Xyrichtys novacula TaxID=13765 RepID=A0AAV1GVM1_XYRNO|nr:dynein%2C light chain, LC8-type 2b [Xyrichtys novacula]
MSEKRVEIKSFDMPDEMQQDAVDCAMRAMEKYKIENDIAAYVKKEFDKKYNPTWQCCVGKNYGTRMMCDSKQFIYFYLDRVAVLLFKSG